MGSISVKLELTGTEGPHAAFVLTDDQVATVGEGKKAFPVRISVGDFSFAGRCVRMGGRNLIGVNQAVRGEGGLVPGTEMKVTVALDAAERTVDVPDALATALDAAGVRAAFDELSYTNRKEMARTIAEAKKDETRERRLAKALDSLR
jgi:hypothetical protein